ncbi:hypothetical protein IVG45_21560 [Methylomonas sp. LL1]|uniref:hypothetical protein n=1 Tax=Methylomonas sp. LL1 TaxID=2785785 RepID=UPI0018C354C0|nr:hypothetical protein [Methylomonas sp. LL1]QPK63355.1 hypothetical protein IVG45_21560 [Methylomonas sp. LL1]
MNSLKLKLGWSAILASVLFFQGAEAATLIDDFQDAQVAVNGSDGPLAISQPHTDLLNLQRTLTATAGGSYQTLIGVDQGVLGVSTDSDTATSSASVYYTFEAIDLTSTASGIFFNVDFIDSSFQLRMIANATSSFGFKTFDQDDVGRHFVSFSEFSDSSVFAGLQSLELKFEGVNAWDAEFSLMAADVNNVPEPPVLALLGFGLLVVNGFGRTKPRPVN